MDVFKLLDKSNCRKCNKPTCLAFAAAVFQGQRQLEECPHLDRDVIVRFGGQVAKMKVTDQDLEKQLAQLKKIRLIRHLNGSIQDVVVAVYLPLTRDDELWGFWGIPPTHHPGI